MIMILQPGNLYPAWKTFLILSACWQGESSERSHLLDFLIHFLKQDPYFDQSFINVYIYDLENFHT